MVVRAEGEVPTKTLDLSMNDQAVSVKLNFTQ
jgi:hypothetical protein